jgi:hypothetical protein
MTYPCPHCRAMASADTGCPSCGRGPDADAIEVMRTDDEIAKLLPQLATARRAVSDLETRIGHAYQRRNQAAERVRASMPPGIPKPTGETTSRTLQNVLFVLGGLLLAVAAIVFTAVAWSQFGVGGRAAILAVVTTAALVIPLLALRRGLRSAAETVTAIGLLLILLDGYAAWYLNLFGLADGNPARYAGAVFAITAAAAAAYTQLTGLIGPRYAALLAAQTALPLLIAPGRPAAVAWSLTFGVLAAVEAAVRRSRPSPAAFAAGAAVALAVSVPAGLHLPWWSAPLPGVVVVAVFVAVTARRTAPSVAGAIAALMAGTQAIASTVGHPALATGILAAIALLGCTAATRARHTGLAAAGLLTALLAVPAIAWTATAALNVTPAWQLRAVAIATAALAGTPRLLSTRRPFALTAALVAALVAAAPLPLWAVAADEPAAVYAVLALLLAACAPVSRTAEARPLTDGGVNVRPVAGGWAGRVPAVAAVGAAGFVLVLALLGDVLASRAATLAALGALLAAAAVTSTAGRDGATRGLGVAAAVGAGWGIAFAAPPGAVLEAYTIPAAGLALAAALLAQGNRTPSWVSYGPALTTALAPSLVLLFSEDEHYLRRLLLGLGALVILLVGARVRLQAPVLAASVALGLVALHELAQVWDLVPRWIPLAAGGLLLVLLATTLERRRRDLDRFRGALARMG